MKSSALTSLAFASLALFGSTAANASSTAAIPRKPVGNARIASDLITSVCGHLPTPCNPKTTKALERSKAPQSSFYLIDESRPMFVALDASEPRNARRARMWDFSSYRHSHRSIADAGTADQLVIYPALYPAGDQEFAIAILNTYSEGYSGGGASFRIADFVVLSDKRDLATPDPKWDVAYAAVPFSCSTLIRACFSEKEYRSSPHCHDENSGYLTIQFPKNPQADRSWTFTWHESAWPAHVKRTKEHISHFRFTLPANRNQNGQNALPENVPFCGEPAS